MFAAGMMAVGVGRTIRCWTEVLEAAAGWRWHWPADQEPLSDAEVVLAVKEVPVLQPIVVYFGRHAAIDCAI